MKILVTGGRGQLGRSVVARAAGHQVWAPDVDEFDICDPAQMEKVAGHDLVINAAAYTAVDKAEDERERDQAFATNRDGANYLALACARRGIRFLHVSTDYVFDGSSTRPYREDDPIAPLGIYGASKAEGEHAVLAAGGTVVRTSWLFAEGGPSFVHTMLRLARDRPQLRVVADQRGCPTYASDLADGLLALGTLPRLDETYHYCNTGETTWHAFATAIIDEARSKAPLACKSIEAVSTAEYPTVAKRPRYSVLDTAKIRRVGIVPPPWSVGLSRVVAHALES